MSDAIETIKSLLGNDAEGKIKEIMSALTESSSSPEPENSAESLLQMKNVLSSLMSEADDPRINLLTSLRPYMRNERQQSIDSAIRILGLTKLSDFLK